ncbi:MAG: 4-(cytidine 5'-diphospho)-2-C-methyl-D-erythritol kinase [Barnesiella sp.]|nr:4-(cytidine 5'-diphospho)-2-C-methyl-D-erythritol kinase [Barnesiella sp.]
MITFPNAKINIGLYITARRPDGYHDIVTAMVPTDWRDILEIVPAKGNESTLTVTGRGVDCPTEKNLVMKAFRAMESRYGLPPVDIYLQKIIPDGAGLGGGSADAAFTITTLNAMFNLGLDEATMASVAATIGSDCPFFIYNRPMLATGTGTTLSPIEIDIKGYSLVIVKPQVHVSTAEAYGGCKPRPMSIDLPQVLAQCAPADWERYGVINDFEATVFPRHEQIARVKSLLYNTGADYAAMSGSGASVFALFKRDILAEEIEAVFPEMDIHVSKL